MLSMIVAADLKNVIGNKNQLPWHLPADLQHFKQITEGHTIIMGRKTFESFPKGPLPNRKHLVLTRDKNWTYNHPDVLPIYDKNLIITNNMVTDDKEHFVIGGSEIFKLFMPYTRSIHLTKIMGEFEGDTYLPPLEGEWEMSSFKRHWKDEKNSHDMIFYTYERKEDDGKI